MQAAPQAPATAPGLASTSKLAPPSKPATSLPPGWGQATDPSSGRTYYFHSVTGVRLCHVCEIACARMKLLHPVTMRKALCSSGSQKARHALMAPTSICTGSRLHAS